MVSGSKGGRIRNSPNHEEGKWSGSEETGRSGVTVRGGRVDGGSIK